MEMVERMEALALKWHGGPFRQGPERPHIWNCGMNAAGVVCDS